MTDNETSYTPGQVRAERDTDPDSKAYTIVSVAPGNKPIALHVDEGDARRMVTAWNCFDELVAALDDMVFGAIRDCTCNLCVRARAILKKVKESDNA